MERNASESGLGYDSMLLDLAPEILNLFMSFLTLQCLKNVRLACHQLNNPTATIRLFQTVTLLPTVQSVYRWNNIFQDNRLRHIPRHVIIYTHENPDGHGARYKEAGPMLQEALDDFDKNFGVLGGPFGRAILGLSQLTNLEALDIRFTEDVLANDQIDWCAEMPETRSKLLTAIYTAWQKHSETQGNSKIRKLGIKHLQNLPIPDFTSSDLFRSCMSNLEELHIKWSVEYNEHGPDHDLECEELRTFPPHLRKAWLEPISHQLTALSLYCTDNWGPLPETHHLDGLSFPKLKSLALGYYTIAHDDQFDWIIAQKSLQQLILHNAMISPLLYVIPEETESWTLRKDDWVPLPVAPDRREIYTYAGRWHHFLDKLRLGLPALRDFRISCCPDYRSGKRDEPWDVMTPQYEYRLEKVGCEMSPKRYVYFDHGTLPTRWGETDPEGVLEAYFLEDLEGDFEPGNPHMDNLVADQAALDRLMEAIGARR